MENQVSYISAEDWAKVLAKSWEDEEFKEALERNPKEAIKSAFPQFLPPGTWVFNLPPRPKNLDDEDLASMEARRDYIIPYLCI